MDGLFTQTQLLRSLNPVKELSCHAHVAYYMKDRFPDDSSFHEKEVDTYFHRLAGALGYTVTREAK